MDQKRRSVDTFQRQDPGSLSSSSPSCLVMALGLLGLGIIPVVLLATTTNHRGRRTSSSCRRRPVVTTEEGWVQMAAGREGFLEHDFRTIEGQDDLINLVAAYVNAWKVWMKSRDYTTTEQTEQDYIGRMLPYLTFHGTVGLKTRSRENNRRVSPSTCPTTTPWRCGARRP